jgi:hypothetical protein
MRFRNLIFMAGIAFSLTLPTGQATAQSAAGKSAKTTTWTTPRTPDGHPDFEGVWANNSATPLERPKIVEGRAYLTEQEVAALKTKSAELFDNGNSDAAFFDQVFETVVANMKGDKKGFKSTDGQTGDYSSVWTESRDWDNRTSLITDPPDGRIPPMTPQAQERLRVQFGAFVNRPAGPEDRALSERCITYGTPQLVAGYQSYRQIVQTPHTVAIMTEMIHDTRIVPIVPLDVSPHLPSTVQTWDGDARGHWEGDTLVVDSTNFKPGAFRNSTDKLHLVERYRRASPETLEWEVTIDDPATWTKPWTAKILLRRADKAIYEYACHEGNYGLMDILEGARHEEEEERRTAPRK